MVQADILRPLTAESRVRVRLSPCGMCVVDRVALGRVFLRLLRFYRVSDIIPSGLYNCISPGG
jgi:hypothetical protein